MGMIAENFHSYHIIHRPWHIVDLARNTEHHFQPIFQLIALIPNNFEMIYTRLHLTIEFSLALQFVDQTYSMSHCATLLYVLKYWSALPY